MNPNKLHELCLSHVIKYRLQDLGCVRAKAGVYRQVEQMEGFVSASAGMTHNTRYVHVCMYELDGVIWQAAVARSYDALTTLVAGRPFRPRSSFTVDMTACSTPHDG